MGIWFDRAGAERQVENKRDHQKGFVNEGLESR